MSQILYSRWQCAPKSARCAILSPRLSRSGPIGLFKHTHRESHHLIRYSCINPHILQRLDNGITTNSLFIRRIHRKSTCGIDEMTTSSYLKKALFYDQTSAINEYFEKKADQLFEDAEARSYFGFYVHRPSHRAPDDSGVHHDELTHMWNWDSDPGYDSESESPSRTEQHQRADAPPPYTRAPVERWRIDRFRISNVQQLRHHAAVG